MTSVPNVDINEDPRAQIVQSETKIEPIHQLGYTNQNEPVKENTSKNSGKNLEKGFAIQNELKVRHNKVSQNRAIATFKLLRKIRGIIKKLVKSNQDMQKACKDEWEKRSDKKAEHHADITKHQGKCNIAQTALAALTPLGNMLPETSFFGSTITRENWTTISQMAHGGGLKTFEEWSAARRDTTQGAAAVHDFEIGVSRSEFETQKGILDQANGKLSELGQQILELLRLEIRAFDTRG